MVNNDIENVLTFLRGIGSGNTDLASASINPKRYIEHNPRSTDGRDGLQTYMGQLAGKEHHLEVVRAFQDGAYVFTHSEGLIFGENIFFDLFRLEDGLIAEHWIFSAKAAPPNQSGHTQTDGPTQAEASADTETNKSLVREYYETIHVSGNHSKILQYFAGDHCIRHEPGVRDGVSAFQRDLERLVKNRTIDEIKYLFGQADFVFIAAKGSHEGRPCAYIDLYRVADGKIAERWGFPEEYPPQEKSQNGNSIL